MAKVTRSNPGAFETLNFAIEQLDRLQVKTGWFQSSVYPDGTPVAYIASVQEFGSSIDHPGGTPYFVTSDGTAHFVRKNTAFSFGLPQTEPHKIVIPPRPFMRPTIIAKREEWTALMVRGSKAVLKNRISMRDVMDQLGAKTASDVAETIAGLWSPPLKKSTIQARARKLSDRTVTASLQKPLVATGKLFDDLTHVVEDANTDEAEE